MMRVMRVRRRRWRRRREISIPDGGALRAKVCTHRHT
jgi:hypothetical protein